ncbi:isocitrate lyase/phosphoenolpyruvate mutase family protein [Micromonospora sp. U56]|uniref:isocitrate lyase/phosphoenolpyruvate mutase family protein n=1 Tax=Micromonospora sp. U56 TaxID=2824900 RepID=UPI001FFC4CAC|nr:isocitrate lyase/phosphoenolpyruvate mutase family protein [Micromonospora sp. U56]
MTTSQQRAARLRALHRPGTPLVLPNAWDVASARLVEECGAEAYGLVRRAATETLTGGTYTALTPATSYGDLNALLR